MKNDSVAKRWIAVVIALVLAIISVFAGTSAEDKMEEKIADQYLEKFNPFNRYSEEVLEGTNPNQRIMIINVDGVIADGDQYQTIMSDLNTAREDDTIKGIIMRVNSPGGSVYNSEQIHNYIKKVQEERKIPVYTVMETMAASGGYYISAPTDRIYASNETFTGSIGVIMQSYSLQGLFEKYGIKEQNITTGKMKDAGSAGKDMTDEQKQYFQDLADSAFSRFVKVVADGRSMSESDVKKLADGRVYDGSQAVKNGLVDEIGDLEKALEDMTEEANLQDPIIFQNADVLSNFQRFFFKAKDLRKNSQSDGDLQVIKELMDKAYPVPMYMYGE
jgi:protease-4